jgi:hypothetical protein
MTKNIPQSPYTTEGIPASKSIMGLTADLIHLGAYSARYMDVKMLRGMAITIATTVTQSVPVKKDKKPNCPFNGDHAVEKSSSFICPNDRMGSDFWKRPQKMKITSNAEKIVADSIKRPVILSLIFLTVEILFITIIWLLPANRLQFL